MPERTSSTAKSSFSTPILSHKQLLAADFDTNQFSANARIGYARLSADHDAPFLAEGLLQSPQIDNRLGKEYEQGFSVNVELYES
jgi:hypothetical protein